MKHAVAAIMLAALSLPAFAGWYEVTNYEGTIGAYPVHVSLQTFDRLESGDKVKEGRVVGSYYYDSKRTPIALHGKQLADGTLRLCEVQDIKALTGFVPHSAEKLQQDPCPFLVTRTTGRLTGKWQSAKAMYDVALTVVGTLNDSAKPVLTGRMEVPMWDRGAQHLYLGVYELEEDQVVMRKVRAVSIATGRVDREVTVGCRQPDYCAPGMGYTDIYMNVTKTPKVTRISVGMGGGKMASDEEFVLKPVR